MDFHLTETKNVKIAMTAIKLTKREPVTIATTTSTKTATITTSSKKLHEQ